jgi:predicted MFS family arabinose efflux permease
MSGSRLVRLFLGWIAVRAVLHNGWWLVTSLYMVVDAGLKPAELLIIAAAQGVAAVVFEVPAGVVADAFSRKWAIVIAHLLMAIAMIMTGIFPDFLPLLIAQMIWGISWTFSSGADVAWITDELDDHRTITAVLTRQARWQLIGAAAGMISIGGLGWLVGRQPAIIAAGISMAVLGLVVARTFPERNFIPVRVDRWKSSLAMARRGLRLATSDRIILGLVIVTILVNGAADSFGRIYPIRLTDLGLPIDNEGTLWFTALGIAGLITGVAALSAVERGIHSDSGAWAAMLVACIAGAAGLGTFAVAPGWQFAVVGLLVATGVAMPILRTVTTIWVNRRTTNDIRATTHSFLAQAEYVGEIGCAAILAGLAGLSGITGPIMVAMVLYLISTLVVAAISPKPSSRRRSVSDPMYGAER